MLTINGTLLERQRDELADILTSPRPSHCRRLLPALRLRPKISPRLINDHGQSTKQIKAFVQNEQRTICQR